VTVLPTLSSIGSYFRVRVVTSGENVSEGTVGSVDGATGRWGGLAGGECGSVWLDRVQLDVGAANDFWCSRAHPSPGPFVQACGLDQPELRSALIGAQTLGLCMARYVLAVEPLANLEPSSFIEIAGQAAQQALPAKLSTANR
jgi:hypothetical protein